MNKGLRLAALAVTAMLTVAASPPRPAWVAGLDRVVGDKRTVVFGEDSHGMAAVHAAVPPMFEHLVERKGFRVFVFEVQWHVTDAFRDFMASDRTTLNQTEQFYLDGAFVSDDIAAMLVWIRTWNRAHPGDPIAIYGYQPEQAFTDSRALVTFLDRYAGPQGPALADRLKACKALDPAITSDLDMVIASGKLNKAGKPSYTDAERAACLGAVDRVASYLKANDATLAARSPRRERVLARLHAVSLRAYVGHLRREVDFYFSNPSQTLEQQTAGQGRMYHGGDRTRFEILQGLQAEFFPNKKVFYWMHDWHAARHASEMGPAPGEAGIPQGTVSIGERIVAAAGSEAVVIGNLVPCAKCKEPEGSVEPAFARRFGDTTTLVDLRDRRAAAGLPIDRPGTFFANQNGFGFGNVVLSRQFDAILYVPKTDPVH